MKNYHTKTKKAVVKLLKKPLTVNQMGIVWVSATTLESEGLVSRVVGSCPTEFRLTVEGVRVATKWDYDLMIANKHPEQDEVTNKKYAFSQEYDTVKGPSFGKSEPLTEAVCSFSKDKVHTVEPEGIAEQLTEPVEEFNKTKDRTFDAPESIDWQREYIILSNKIADSLTRSNF